MVNISILSFKADQATSLISKNKSLVTNLRKLSFSASVALSALCVGSIITIQSAQASICSCDQGKLYTIDIEELNGIHPHQLTLKANNAYYQLVDDKGSVIQDKLYDINAYEDGRIVAKRNGLFGALDASGNVTLDFKYDEIEALDNGFYQLTQYFGSKPATAIATASGNWLYPASGTFDKNTQVDYLYADQVNQVTYFTITINGKHGLINDKQQTMIAPIYDELTLLDTCPNERLFMKAIMGDQTGLIDQYQKVVVPFAKNTVIGNFNEDKQIFRVLSYKTKPGDNDYNGDALISEKLVSGKGVSIIQSESSITRLEGNLYKYEKSGKYGIINDKGDIVLPENFDGISSDFNSSILVSKNQKMGFLTKSEDNSFQINHFYNDLKRYYGTTYTLREIENQAVKEEEYNYDNDEDVAADETEEIDYKLSFLEYNPPTAKYIAQLNHKFGIVDTNNKVLVPIIYDELSDFQNFIKVKKDQKYGLLTDTNDIAKPPIYDDIISLDDAYGESLGMVFTKGHQQQLTNKFGSILSDFSDSRFVSDKLNDLEEMSVIEKDGKYGLFSYKDKKVTVSPIYEDMSGIIHNNSILAQLNGKKLLIDSSGKMLIDDLSQYTDITRSNDSDKIEVTTKNDKHGLIDYAGKTIIEPIYDSLEVAKLSADYVNVWSANDIKDSIERYIVEENGKYGVFDTNGKQIAPIAYTHIQPILYPPYFLVTKDEVDDEYMDNADSIHFGLMNSAGKLVLEMKYDAIMPNYYDPEGKLYGIDTHRNSVDVYDKALKLLETQNLTTFAANNEWYDQ